MVCGSVSQQSKGRRRVMSRQKPKMAIFSNLLHKPDNKCPYCDFVFDPIPHRKKKCPSCGQFVYVRRRPNSNNKELVTAEVAELIDKEWEEINTERAFRSVLQRYNASELEYKAIERELTKKFETIYRGKISEIVDKIEPKGEFVVVIWKRY